MFSEDEAVESGGLSGSEIQELLYLIQSTSDQPLSPNSGSPSQGSNSSRTVYSLDERKLRRTASNRESARRSRWRKKRQLENLTEQLNKLKTENRYLSDRLNPVLSRSVMLRCENERLTLESIALFARLCHLCNAAFYSHNDHAMYPITLNQY